MSFVKSISTVWDFNRNRTLKTLDEIAELTDPVTVLGWRPGEGRAHIAWQLMHVGITEELFATERLTGTAAAWPEFVPRFRGGSTPDEDIPDVETIRDVLNLSRQHLRETMASLSEAALTEIPEAFRERGWTIEDALRVLAWHEPHHQGQAHLTLNLWKASQE